MPPLVCVESCTKYWTDTDWMELEWMLKKKIIHKLKINSDSFGDQSPWKKRAEKRVKTFSFSFFLYISCYQVEWNASSSSSSLFFMPPWAPQSIHMNWIMFESEEHLRLRKLPCSLTFSITNSMFVPLLLAKKKTSLMLMSFEEKRTQQ